MSHKKLRTFIVKVSILGYFPLPQDTPEYIYIPILFIYIYIYI